MKVSKVVLPVAGWGTRSLPASKNIPKEMLPIYNKPVIQYVVEEAVRAGVQEVIFVTNRHKCVVEDHFDRNIELEELLAEAGKIEQLKAVQDAASMVEVMAVRQKQQLGLGHAVGCARSMVQEDYFAVMVGDDFMVGDNAGLVQLVQAAEKYNMPTIGVMEVPADKIDKYGMVAGEELEEGVYRITDMVEKPAVGSMNSRLAIVGRYVKQVGVKRFNFLGCALFLASWLLLFFAQDTYAGMIGGILLIDIGMQCIQISNQTSMFEVAPQAANRVNTIFMTTYFIGGSVGTLLAGSAWALAQWSGVVCVGILLALASLSVTAFTKY